MSIATAEVWRSEPKDAYAIYFDVFRPSMPDMDDILVVRCMLFRSLQAFRWEISFLMCRRDIFSFLCSTILCRWWNWTSPKRAFQKVSWDHAHQILKFQVGYLSCCWDLLWFILVLRSRLSWILVRWRRKRAAWAGIVHGLPFRSQKRWDQIQKT